MMPSFSVLLMFGRFVRPANHTVNRHSSRERMFQPDCDLILYQRLGKVKGKFLGNLLTC